MFGSGFIADMLARTKYNASLRKKYSAFNKNNPVDKGTKEI